jgi:hypothetical protein
MAINVLPAIESGGSNDFSINNTALNTTTTDLPQDYSAGGYTLTCTDSSFDIYLFNSDGSSAGYTNVKSITATKSFNKIVVVGGSTEIIEFQYKASYTSSSANSEIKAGPFITSSSNSNLFTVNSTTSIIGGNFASDITGLFTSGTTATEYAATITRNSATSLTVGRPSTLPAEHSPYTLTLSNPGVTNPTGSNLNKLSGFSAGTIPVITSPSTISYTTGAATSITLTATDSDGATSGVTWSVSSGTLPTGLSLNASTGVLSGTPTTSQVTVSFTVTDSGNNISTPKSILFNGNPVWVTAAGALPFATGSTAYSQQLSATDEAGGVTYTLTSGSLPSGLSINSSGLISGTASSGNGNASFTITATDSNGGTTNRSFSIGVLVSTYYSASTSWTAPAGVTTAYFDLIGGGGAGGNWGSTNVGCGGGGSGGKLSGTVTVVPGNSYSLVIGGGGAGVGGATTGNNGTNTTFAGQTGIGGGGGATNGSGGNGGGCGGGGARGGGGAGSQGNEGGGSAEQWIGGGGGGLGASGGYGGYDAGAGGAGITFKGYSFGGGGGGGSCNGRAAGAGGSVGGGAGGNTSGAGSSGGANKGGGGGGAAAGGSGSGGSGLAFIGYLG